jgi:hypothetical protein
MEMVDKLIFLMVPVIDEGDSEVTDGYLDALDFIHYNYYDPIILEPAYLPRELDLDKFSKILNTMMEVCDCIVLPEGWSKYRLFEDILNKGKEIGKDYIEFGEEDDVEED